MRQYLIFTIIVLSFCLYLSPCEAEIPELENRGKIQDGAGDLDVSYHSNPCTVDWNNDGLKDLVVGEDSGYILLYLNQGTDLNPVFNGYTLIEANGTPIRVSND